MNKWSIEFTINNNNSSIVLLKKDNIIKLLWVKEGVKFSDTYSFINPSTDTCLRINQIDESIQIYYKHNDKKYESDCLSINSFHNLND